MRKSILKSSGNRDDDKTHGPSTTGVFQLAQRHRGWHVCATCRVIGALGGSGEITCLGFAWVQTWAPSGRGCEAGRFQRLWQKEVARSPSGFHSGKPRHYRKLGEVGVMLMKGHWESHFSPSLLSCQKGRHGTPPGLPISPPWETTS